MEDETPMTIDELAAMVAKGFAELEQKMDTKFEYLEQKMDAKFQYLEQKMDKGFGEVNQRIDNIVAVHDDHSRRIKLLELKTA